MNKQNRLFSLYSPDLGEIIMASEQPQAETILLLFSYELAVLG